MVYVVRDIGKTSETVERRKQIDRVALIESSVLYRSLSSAMPDKATKPGRVAGNHPSGPGPVTCIAEVLHDSV